MDERNRGLERRAAISGDIDTMAHRLRALVRSGLIPPVGLVTPDVMLQIGHAKPSSVRNLHVRVELVDEGFTAGEEYTHHVQGIDCKGWTHCGWECCGPCPHCGDDWERASPRDEQRVLLYPPLGLSARKAQSLCYKVMTRVAKRLYG